MIFLDKKIKNGKIKTLKFIIMKSFLELIGLFLAAIFKILWACVLLVAATSVNLLVGALIGALAGLFVEWIFGNPLESFSRSFWQMSLIIGFVSAFFRTYIKFGTKKTEEK